MTFHLLAYDKARASHRPVSTWSGGEDWEFDRRRRRGRGWFARRTRRAT